MTTGDPDTPASVTNSGTEQNAILDFVIPKGCTGSSSTPQALLNAYSTPPQPGKSGSALLFDKNSTTYGTSISHTEGESDFSLADPGFYLVSYNGVVAPVGTDEFPVAIAVMLQLNGTPVPGAGTQHTFQSASEASNVAASQVLQVTGPSTVNLMGSGGDFLYSDLGMSICKLGEG